MLTDSGLGKKKGEKRKKTARVEAGSGERKAGRATPSPPLPRARGRETASPPPPPVGVPPEGDEPTGHEDESQ